MRTVGLRLTTLTLAWLCTTFVAHAQRHYFIPYSVNEGLAQSQVRDIVQSEDGFLWIATVGGISRFDGVNFTTYNKSNGLINNLTNALYPGKDGSMVASCPGGLVFFTDSAVVDHRFSSPHENVLINDLILDGDRYILGSNGKGLLYFTNDSISSTFDLGSTNRNFIRCLSRYNGSILAGTKDGLLLISDDGSTAVVNDSISVNEIISTEEGHWIATNGDGLFLLAQDSLQQFSREEGLKNRYVRDITVDHLGNPWVLSKNRLQVFDRKKDEFRSILASSPEQTSNMKVIYTDSERNIWIGTDGYGILRFTGGTFQLFSTEDGLSSDIIMDIDQTADSTYYFATYGYGVVERKGQIFDTIDYDQGLSNLTVWSLLPVENDVWFGTSNGIQILKNGRVQDFEANDRLPFPRVSNLFQDSQGRIWVATRDGVAVWDGSSLQIPPSLDDLNLRDCKRVLELGESIWITSNSGMVRFDRNGNAERIDTDQGLPESYITAAALGNENDLWLGSEEGLIHFDVPARSFQLFSLSDKVSSNIINFLEVEEGERLWIGTDNGLFQVDFEAFYDQENITVRSFNKYDGIISNECNQNASFVDKNGDVWFGTNGGLLKYSSEGNLRKAPSVIGVVLNDVQQNFESVLSSVDRQATDPSRNSFRYDESRLTFRFAAIHFSNPDKVNYSYKLEGLEDDWSPATTQDYITYSNLPSGEYAFNIRSRVGEGPWKEGMNPFRFYVAPPFYMRWWFILIVLGALTLLGWLIARQLQREQRRKRELKESKDRAKVLGLEQQTLNAHMNRHFIFNALNSIQYYINTQDRDQANQYLSNFASLVRKNLDSAQSESISLEDELERLKLYINLEQMRFKGRFDFQIDVEPGLDIAYIHVPSMILQPFVENSIMHGILPAERFGTIKIQIHSSDKGLLMTIDDNGIGIDESRERKNGTSRHVSNGMKITKQRIAILADALQSDHGVKGPYQLQNEDGKSLGTRVEILLPANFNQFSKIYG